jgi:deoxyribodipyrimidine photo-lyase
LLREPTEIANQQGRPFQVFTAYWRHASALPVDLPVRLPVGNLAAPAKWPVSLELDELELLPRLNWADGFRADWTPGAAGAAAHVKRFLAKAVAEYSGDRDRPDREGTSRLSPHLHFGEVGPRQVWAAVRALGKDSGVFPVNAGAGVFLREIGWREFAHHVLYHFPSAPTQPIRPEFARFPWAEDADGSRLAAWQKGRTGYPIVDAGMRQLWHSGWMHNRVRMIVASFLVKHLRLPWQHGARWFWDTLVDADLPNNTLGWQWSAGCGVDAAPYFRIFAPVLQGRKFDPSGDYVRRWVPELAGLSAESIHAPWEVPALELSAAGVRLGQNYPAPIVDHATARRDALAAFKELRAAPTS